jgi:hypothetical protein
MRILPSCRLSVAGAGAAAGQDAGGAVRARLSTTSTASGVVPATMAATGLAAIAGAIPLALSIRFCKARDL